MNTCGSIAHLIIDITSAYIVRFVSEKDTCSFIERTTILFRTFRSVQDIFTSSFSTR